jgi:hypothetical protein
MNKYVFIVYRLKPYHENFIRVILRVFSNKKAAQQCLDHIEAVGGYKDGSIIEWEQVELEDGDEPLEIRYE